MDEVKARAKRLKDMKERHNRQILDFLKATDAEERKLKDEMQANKDEKDRGELAKKYSKLSGKFQDEMNQLMERQRRELAEAIQEEDEN